jgi:hypothetical protein
MPTLGYIKKQNGFFQAEKVAAYGGQSSMCKTFKEALNYINASIGNVRAKTADETRHGAAGPHGGPTTWRVYTPDPPVPLEV